MLSRPLTMWMYWANGLKVAQMVQQMCPAQTPEQNLLVSKSGVETRSEVMLGTALRMSFEQSSLWHVYEARPNVSL